MAIIPHHTPCRKDLQYLRILRNRNPVANNILEFKLTSVVMSFKELEFRIRNSRFFIYNKSIINFYFPRL